MNLDHYTKEELIRRLAVAEQRVLRLQSQLRDTELNDEVLSQQRLRERADILHAFHTINQFVLRDASIEEILYVFAREIVHAGLFRSLMTAIVRPEENCIEIVRRWLHVGKGENAPEGDRRSLDGSDVLADVVRTGKMEVVEGWDEKRYSADSPEGRDRSTYEDKVSYFVPIKDGSEVIAVIATGSSRAEKEETLARIDLLAPFLDHFALVLKHFRLSRDRDRDAAELRSQNEVLQTIFDNIPVMISFFNAQGRFVLVNRAFQETLGWTADEVLAHPNLMEEFYPDANERDRMIKFVQRGAGEWGDFKTHTKDGRVLDTAWANVLLADGTSIGIGQDLTQIKEAERQRTQLEDQLEKAQHLEAIGRLAGGVAHDFNNLLTGIINLAAFLREDFAADDPRWTDADEIVTAGERAADLTGQLLAFSRRQVVQPKVVNLNEVTGNIGSMLERLIGEHIEISTVLAADLQRVLIDPGKMEQVIVNLAVNARDAMPDGGKLTIETANVELDEQYARDHAEVEPGAYVMMAVSDTGMGMDDETRAHLFEPFFTTKRRGEGTGLGLATVYGIIKQAGGHIWVYSELGRGASFKVYLPSTDRRADAQQDEEHVHLQGGAETILVVEDEEIVRRMMQRMLEEHGYVLLLAASGQEAVEIFDEREGAIDLLLTDVVLPDISGVELAKDLTARRADLKVLYMSGYTDNAIVHQGVLYPEVNFLPKPLTLASLVGKVRAVLDESP